MIRHALLTLTLLTPYQLVLAQTPRNFRDVSNLFVGLITSLIPILVGAATLVFFWGLVKFLVQSDNPDAHARGRELMMWGVIAIFIMLSIWGIVRFMQRSIFG